MKTDEMRLNDAAPNILSVCRRLHTSSGKTSSPKHTYTYRLMYTISGEVTFNIGDKKLICKSGGVLFLTPGLDYTTEFNIRELEIYHLFFDITHFRDSEISGRFPEKGIFLPGVEGYTDCGIVKITDIDAFNSPFVADGFHIDEPKFRSILREYEKAEPYSRLRMNATLTEILVDLARICLQKQKANPRSDLARAISEYITENVGEPLDCGSVADRFSYHPNYLTQVTRAEYGKTLLELITDIKIDQATLLLDTTAMSITQIAQSLAFFDASHFDKVYLRKTGMRPKDRRRLFG